MTNEIPDEKKLLLIQTLKDLIDINEWAPNEALPTLITVASSLYENYYSGKFSEFLVEISTKYKEAGR